MTIKVGTASYNAFVENPIPVISKFYFWDILNPSDIIEKGEKPILKERGPYTFRSVQSVKPMSNLNNVIPGRFRGKSI